MPFFWRPLWLLPSPEPLEQQRGRPCRCGPLELLQGPERIESGWWDGADISRDYYRARDSRGALLWIYRVFPGQLPARSSHGAHRWFLHGIFG
jgi:protein ImuB